MKKTLKKSQINNMVELQSIINMLKNSMRKKISYTYIYIYIILKQINNNKLVSILS